MNSLNDLMLGRIARNRFSSGPAALPPGSDATVDAPGLAAESVETASSQPLTLASPLETSEVPSSSKMLAEAEGKGDVGARSTTTAEADAAPPMSLSIEADAALQKVRRPRRLKHATRCKSAEHSNCDRCETLPWEALIRPRRLSRMVSSLASLTGNTCWTASWRLSIEEARITSLW